MTTTNLADRIYDGGCPNCHQDDGYVNVGRDHWYRCDIHKVRWSPGSNLYSGWRDEDEETWRANAELLATYVEVEPVYTVTSPPSDPRPVRPPHPGVIDDPWAVGPHGGAPDEPPF